MARHHKTLPQLGGTLMLTDGGLETTLVFHEGIDLPLFAAFPLLLSDAGRETLNTYIESFAQIAVDAGFGFLMDTPTWRASARWAAELGFSSDELKKAHKTAVEMLAEIRARFETPATPCVINGVLGPQDDGYSPSALMTAEAAEAYHAAQVAWFTAFGADMVSAITMTYADEAIGIARAAKAAGVPSVISFTVETDGRLPSGQSLASAIGEVDAATDAAPAYYMINCAHPDHFRDVLAQGGAWRERILGIRANASRCSHAELDAAEELDAGNPVELARDYSELQRLLPHLTVFGGCCGTDQRHVTELARACDRHAAMGALV